MWYYFRKYFFDLNIDSETYIYFIMVEIKCCFFKIRNFTFHYFRHPVGSTTKSKTVKVNIDKGDWRNLNIIGNQLSIISKNGKLHIISNFNDLKINLEINNFEKYNTSDNFIITQKNKRIEWFAVPLFMTGTGTIEVDGNLIKAEKSPVYIDHVFSDILPFRMPVSKMFWGRILLPDMLVTYSVVITLEHKQWARCFVIMNDRQFYFSEIEYTWIGGIPEERETVNDDNAYQFIAVADKNTVKLNIKHIRTAATGAFIDPKRYKFIAAYKALNSISKNPRGKKFISEADMLLNIEGQELQFQKLVCIDEYVVF